MAAVAPVLHKCRSGTLRSATSIVSEKRKETQLLPRTTTLKRKDRTSSFVTRLIIVSTTASISMQTPTYKASSPPSSSYVVRKITPPSFLQHRNPETKSSYRIGQVPSGGSSYHSIASDSFKPIENMLRLQIRAPRLLAPGTQPCFQKCRIRWPSKT